MDSGEKCGTPELRSDDWEAWTEDEVAREILIFSAEAVGEPTAERWAAGERRAGVHHEERRLMIRPVCVHGTDDADVIGACTQLREYFAEFGAALAVVIEFEWRLQKVAGLALGLQIAAGGGFAVILGEHRLGVEGVHLRGATVEKQEDDVFRFWCEVRGPRKYMAEADCS